MRKCKRHTHSPVAGRCWVEEVEGGLEEGEGEEVGRACLSFRYLQKTMYTLLYHQSTHSVQLLVVVFFLFFFLRLVTGCYCVKGHIR